MTNPMTETGEKGMTHEAGIEAAVQRFYGDPSYPLKGHILRDMADAIQAYLTASGMVLVPREATEDMICEAAYDRPEIRTADFAQVYSIMLSVAPDPFKSQP
jgi:hypothetical protein